MGVGRRTDFPEIVLEINNYRRDSLQLEIVLVAREQRDQASRSLTLQSKQMKARDALQREESDSISGVIQSPAQRAHSKPPAILGDCSRVVGNTEVSVVADSPSVHRRLAAGQVSRLVGNTAVSLATGRSPVGCRSGAPVVGNVESGPPSIYRRSGVRLAG